MDIGSKISELRKEMGMTQKELAQESGLSRTYICDIENNRKNISLKTLEKVCSFLNMKIEIKITSLDSKKADNEFYQSDKFGF